MHGALHPLSIHLHGVMRKHSDNFVSYRIESWEETSHCCHVVCTL